MKRKLVINLDICVTRTNNKMLTSLCGKKLFRDVSMNFTVFCLLIIKTV